MRLVPVPDSRALRVELGPDDRGGPEVVLVVAELHLGVETAMSRAGAHLASGTDALADALVLLAEQQGAGRILVAGDLKHTVADTSFQERREVPRFFARVTPHVDVHVVVGNHDVGLERLVPRHHDVVVHPADGVRLGGTDAGGGVGVFHGHAWPSAEVVTADELVAAHTHPAVALVDGMGHVHVEPCWVRAPLDGAAMDGHYGPAAGPRATTITLVPPFNPVLGGAAVNVDGLLGPAGRMVDRAQMQAYLLDGTHLGRPADLPAVPEGWRRRHRVPAGEDL